MCGVAKKCVPLSKNIIVDKYAQNIICFIVARATGFVP